MAGLGTSGRVCTSVINLWLDKATRLLELEMKGPGELVIGKLALNAENQIVEIILKVHSSVFEIMVIRELRTKNYFRDLLPVTLLYNECGISRKQPVRESRVQDRAIYLIRIYIRIVAFRYFPLTHCNLPYLNTSQEKIKIHFIYIIFIINGTYLLNAHHALKVRIENAHIHVFALCLNTRGIEAQFD